MIGLCLSLFVIRILLVASLGLVKIRDGVADEPPKLVEFDNLFQELNQRGFNSFSDNYVGQNSESYFRFVR